ncbi:MAG: hypothetical protein LUD69_07365 [Oscillospiraceae bacterium]|nr:hypothetical protein [Oscillospiraceae bacterium]
MYICSKGDKTFKISPVQKAVYERAGYTITEETAAETAAKAKTKTKTKAAVETAAE